MRVKKKIVELTSSGKTDHEILRIIPSISQSSISRVKKSYSEMIEAKKRNYIKLIDAKIGDYRQAEILSDIVTAEQDVFNFKGQVVGTKPDYKIRLEAIKYIDKLKGREAPTVKSLTQNNTIISKDLDKYTK